MITLTLLYGLFKIKIKTGKKMYYFLNFYFIKTSVNIKYVYRLLSSHTVHSKEGQKMLRRHVIKTNMVVKK